MNNKNCYPVLTTIDWYVIFKFNRIFYVKEKEIYNYVIVKTDIVCD